MRYARSGLRLYAMVMLSVLVAFAPISYLLDPANIGQTMSARILGVAALALAYWAATYRPLDQLRLGLWSALAYAVPSAMVLLEVRLEGSTDHPYLFAPALFWVGLAMLVPLHQTATFAIGLVALSLPVGAMLTGVIDASPRMTGLYVAFAFAITWVAAISSRQRSTLVIQGWRSAESLQQRTEELEAARIEVRQAVDALLKSERRTVMGQLTTGLAGQLLDPLSLLRSRLEDAIGTLEAGSPAHKALSQSLGDLDGATGFLQDITAQTADLARRLEREFDVVAQSRFAARLIERQARGHGIAIRVRGTTGLTMRADPARFAQIVSNLLQHALQRCVSTGVTEPIELLARLSETGITIEISDQATAPLPPRDVLFPDLTGLRVVAGGTDLAMAVVRELTDDMGGSIQVQTQAPGATVLVSLPLKQRPEAAASLPPMLLHEPDAIQDSGQTPN